MADEETIRVDFELTDDDWISFYRFCYSKPINWRRTLLVGIACLIGPSAFLMGPILLSKQSLPPELYRFIFIPIILGVFLLIWVLTNPLLARRHAVKSVKQHLQLRKGLTGNQCIVIDRSGIKQTTDFINAKITWEMVSGLIKTPEALGCNIADNIGIIIPRRAFETEEAFQLFSELVYQFFQEAPNYLRNCPECGYDLEGDVPTGCPECGWGRES